MRKDLRKKITTATLALLVGASAQVSAQQKKGGIHVSAGGDLVSQHYWRGQELAGFSVQPKLTLQKKGLSLTAFGSVGLDKKDTKEFDLTLGYTFHGFTLAATDYYFRKDNEDTRRYLDQRYFNYAAHTTPHLFEGTLAYDFGPFSLTWNTIFGGKDYRFERMTRTGVSGDSYYYDTKRLYSTYVEAAIPFTLAGLDFRAEVGASPWKSIYTGGEGKFSVVNASLTATKNIYVSNSFVLPAFVKVAANPRSETVNFIFGLRF